MTIILQIQIANIAHSKAVDMRIKHGVLTCKQDMQDNYQCSKIAQNCETPSKLVKPNTQIQSIQQNDVNKISSNDKNIDKPHSANIAN